MDNFNLYNRKHVKKTKIKLSGAYKRKQFFKKMVLTLVFLFFVGLTVKGAIIIYKQPIMLKDKSVVYVDDYNFKIGDEVMLTEVSKGSPIDVLLRALKPQEVRYGKVMAGPYAKIIESGEGVYLFAHDHTQRYTAYIDNDERIPDKNDEDAVNYLTNQYVILTEGQHIIIDDTFIAGKVER